MAGFEGSTYKHGDKKLPRVTSILGTLPSEHLMLWYAKVTAQAAAKHREKLAGMDEDAAFNFTKNMSEMKRGVAANLGSKVHSAIEKVILEDTYSDDPALAGHLKQFDLWVSLLVSY